MDPQLLAHDVWELFDVSADASTEGSSGYLDRVVRRCAGWFSASGASIFLRRDGEEDYRLVCTAGSQSRIPAEARIKRGKGIAGACIELGRPLLVGNPAEDPLLASKVSARRPDIGSSMVVPLITPQAGCIGVLNLSRAAGSCVFDEADLAQAKSIGNHIALAVANAQLLAKLDEAADEARRAHSWLGNVVARLGAGVLVIDAQGQILHCNPEAAEFLDNTVATTWSELVDDAPPEVADALGEAALLGRSRRVRWHNPTLDRSWTIACEPMPDGGLVVAIQETTEHDRAEKDMARLGRLAEIGQMTAAVAHEIRNPLTGIRSAAQMIRMSPESAADMCTIIEDETLKLDDLCSEFLSFARPLLLSISAIDLGEIIARVTREYAEPFEEKGVGLAWVEGVWSDIEADPRRVEQVLRNLLRNALQATDPGGQVRLTPLESGFAVSDTGCGMSAEAQTKLFTPFFTTKADGTGLGMCNVRKIVDAHGGTVRVESKAGQGTRVFVEFLRNKQK